MKKDFRKALNTFEKVAADVEKSKKAAVKASGLADLARVIADIHSQN